MKNNPEGNWLVVYMAASARTAQQVEQMLQSEGFLVRSDASSIPGAYELRVLKSEAQEARKLILEKGL